MVKRLHIRTVFPFYMSNVSAFQFARLENIGTVINPLFQQIDKIFATGYEQPELEFETDFVKLKIPFKQGINFLTQMQIWFQFEGDHDRIVGGFTLEDQVDGQQWLNDVYLINLMNKFIHVELYPIHWYTEFQDADFVARLFQMWEKFISTKFLCSQPFSELEIAFYKHDCFDLMLSFLTIIWIVLDAVNSFLNGRELRFHIEQKPYRFQCLQSMIGYPSVGISIGQFLSVYEVVYSEEHSFLNYVMPEWLKKYVTLFLFPNIYSFSCDQPKLIEYQKLCNVFESECVYYPEQKINAVLYEHNNDFISFINESQILIIRNEVNRHWLRQAVFAKVLLQIRLDAKAKIEKQISGEDRSKRSIRRWLFYKKIMQELNELTFNFVPPLSQTDQILRKVLASEHYEESLKILTHQVKDNYWLVLAGIQREYITLAFFVATINFYTIFIMEVFTDLGAESNYVPWKSTYIATGFATFLALIGTAVIIGILAQFFKARRISRQLLKES